MKKPKSKKQKRKSTKIEVRAGKPETRSYKATRLEVRKSADGSMKLAGTAIVFDSASQDLGGFVEIVKWESVQKSLARNSDVFMLWQHDSAQPLARVKTGTLELSLNRAGLDFTATLPQSPLGQNAYQAVKDGTVDGVSFGFSIEPGGDNWITRPDGSLLRELLDINVGEISPVTWAAYLAPHVDVRSCPKALRAKLQSSKRDDDDDLDVCNEDSPDYDPDACQALNDDDDEEDRCECDCDACEDDNHEGCTDPDCDDSDCLDCPAQSTRAAHRDLLLRRLRA
jgi:HK97 family phage prohead protease